MNTRNPYPDVEVPEISLPRSVLDRADERGTAVPLMGPAGPRPGHAAHAPKPVMPHLRGPLAIA